MKEERYEQLELPFVSKPKSNPKTLDKISECWKMFAEREGAQYACPVCKEDFPSLEAYHAHLMDRRKK